MSIIEYSKGHSRRKIGFIGTIPPEAVQVLGVWGYECIELNSKMFDNKELFWDVDCLILIQDSENPKRITTELAQFAPCLLPRDCRIYVKPVDPVLHPSIGVQSLKYIITAIDDHQIPNSGIHDDYRKNFGDWNEGPSLPALGPFVHILESRDTWEQIANIIRNNPSRDIPIKEIKIKGKDLEGNDIALSDEQESLIRRAFFDCQHVELVAIRNGLSGVGAYKAYVTLWNQEFGQKWPYVYFVKLGERKTVATEYRKYLSHALEHIPYHLGPGLREERCALGHKLGIIVTDYVHHAETLRDCARDQRAGAAIGHLFSHTLRNWHNSASMAEEDLGGILAEYVKQDPPLHRHQKIQSCGATRTINELRELLSNIDYPSALVGVIHGDLHATNVLVRGNDAIIIDFEKLQERRGPLLYDVASVEGGLFVDGFVGDKRSDCQKILESISTLYTLQAFDQDILSYNVNNESAWFFECVRQLRMHAREMEMNNHRQYAWILAAALLKKSCNKDNLDDGENNNPEGLSREDVRALAYILAERILLSLNGK